MENNDEKLIRYMAAKGTSPHNIAISFKGQYSVRRIEQIIAAEEKAPKPSPAAGKKSQAPRKKMNKPSTSPKRKAEFSGVGIRNRRIRRDYHQGMSVMELSLEHTLPQPTICKILKGKTPAELKEERNEVIRAKFAAGVSADDLAEENDLTRASIYRICADLRKKAGSKQGAEGSIATDFSSAIEALQKMVDQMSVVADTLSREVERLRQE